MTASAPAATSPVSNARPYAKSECIDWATVRLSVPGVRWRHVEDAGRPLAVLLEPVLGAGLRNGVVQAEEGVRGFEEVDRRRAVVHRHHPARVERPRDLGRLIGTDGRAAADGQEEQVDGADRLALLGPQPRLAEVAEVADADAVEGEDEDRVRAPARARLLVVLGGDRHHLADRSLEAAGRRADDVRVAGDGLDAVVVAVLVRDEKQVRLVLGHGRIGEPEPTAEERAHITEGIDRDGVLCAGERVRGLAVPTDLHRAPRASRFLTFAGDYHVARRPDRGIGANLACAIFR